MPSIEGMAAVTNDRESIGCDVGQHWYICGCEVYVLRALPLLATYRCGKYRVLDRACRVPGLAGLYAGHAACLDVLD